MGPQQPRFNNSPEQPRVPSNPNIYRPPAAPGMERLPAIQPERRGEQPSGHELSPVLSQGLTLPAVPTTVIPAPPPQSQGSVSTPVTAADEDLIENEWVNRAKQIISETEGDPYERERQISELRRTYIRERYGRQIGEVDEV